MERVMSEILKYCAEYTDFELHLVLYGKEHTPFYKIPSTVFVHKPHLKYEDYNRMVYTIKTMYYLREEIKKIHAGIAAQQNGCGISHQRGRTL